MRFLIVLVFALDICSGESVYTMGTRGAWARDFLIALGNANPSAKTVNLVAAWTKAENTNARFNPLATTRKYGSYTDFNTVGVKNYSSRQEGIEATIQTLSLDLPGYAKVKQGLASDNPELALEGMHNPAIPWGTNFGKVEIIYRSSDVTGEELKSELGTSTSTHTTQKIDDTQYATGTTKPATAAEMLTTNGNVTADDVQRYAKITLGAVIGIVGLVLIIKTMLRIDAEKIASTAVKAIV